MVFGVSLVWFGIWGGGGVVVTRAGILITGRGYVAQDANALTQAWLADAMKRSLACNIVSLSMSACACLRTDSQK